jgi:hypothetical protein
VQNELERKKINQIKRMAALTPYMHSLLCSFIASVDESWRILLDLDVADIFWHGHDIHSKSYVL